MKYRLVELLRCPEHADVFLRVTGVQISEMFPCAEELQVPVCRMGCGMLGNWFTDIPNSLPPTHRFDCRRCLGTEIESAVIKCPECGWEIGVIDGVLMSMEGRQSVEDEIKPTIDKKVGVLVEKYLNVRKGDTVLIMAPMPDSVLNNWASNGVEILHADIRHDISVANRAKSCANGQDMMHHLGGPLKSDLFRNHNFDGVLVMVPAANCNGWRDSFNALPDLIKHSGKLILIKKRLTNGNKKAIERCRDFMLKLPQNFDGLNIDIAETPQYDIMVITHPEPENGNGYSSGK